MEKKIGRELLPNENVHPRNAIRDDNRLENLELWVKSQPSGARAEDLVSLAREILNTYGDLFPELGIPPDQQPALFTQNDRYNRLTSK